MSFHNGLYYAYYSVSTFGSQNSGIGLATSTSMDAGTWTDRGLVFRSSSGNNYNAIDPNLVIDERGAPVLTFGEWRMARTQQASHSELYAASTQDRSGYAGDRLSLDTHTSG